MHTLPKPTIVQSRRLPVGAELRQEGAVDFRVWAPKRKQVEVAIVEYEVAKRAASVQSAEATRLPLEIAAAADLNIRYAALEREGTEGYFRANVDDVEPGACYGFRLDGGGQLFADPASRFQPWGPAGLSQVVDASGFRWTDDAWPGVPPQGQVLYEMHIGTFTAAGIWQAAAEQLPELKALGVTVLEVMPVAEFPGRFGWGYDGVLMFSPTRLYGEPDDFRAFVDRAHSVGLGVILDVVYNHFGNIDNYLGQFSDDYYTDRYKNEWASAVNFEGPSGRPVREYFVANARYWIEEFHLDGYRFDAVQCVYDASNPYILGEATAAARAAAEGVAAGRQAYFIGENEPQDVRHLRPVEQHGSGLHALWNDDFHHAAMVRLTGKNPAYYSDYRGTVEELLGTVKRGFLYQGQRSQWQQMPRGTSTRGLPAHALVNFLQNHDQVANSATGLRIPQLTSPGRYRAMTALWLLAPQTPLIFQGQEFGATTPFLFFADFSGDAATAVADGRKNFLAQFPALRLPEEQALLPDPCLPATFERCRLDFTERETHQTTYDLHKDLLHLRRDDPTFRLQRTDLVDGVALHPEILLLRYFNDAGDDRLLLVNFGGDQLLHPTPEPLLAPPPKRGWRMLWTSDDARYGGAGTPPLETVAGWRIPGEAAVVLAAVPQDEAPEPAPGLQTHAETKFEALESAETSST